jgi:CRISPR-associated protein Cas2
MLAYVVTYDIADDATRSEVGDLLEAHGVRVQRSVFEVAFKHRHEYEALKKDVEACLDKNEDSVRWYRLCAQCRAKSEESGRFAEPFARDAIYFF